MEWYLKVLKNYAGFEGRAQRKEYWMFILINMVISIILSVIERMADIGTIISGLYSLAVLLPTIAVTARRLHDTGRSGWMQLIGLIPLVGWIIVLVFVCQDSQQGDNRFGSNPKY